jgi:cytochrome c-type biogenesis protein
MEEISLFLAFGYGVLSFLSPCILPLVPVYLASLTGPKVFEAQGQRRKLPIFLHSLVFVIGFSIIFVLWGAGAGLIGSVLVQYSVLIRQVAGSLLIAFGLFMLAALKIPWLNFERRFTFSLGTTTGYLRSFLIGAIFPVAWIPCTSWVLGGILMLASTSETAAHGACLLAIYSLGLGLPFLAIGAAFDFLTPLLRNIGRYSSWIYIVSSLLLITVGILILANKLVWFSEHI